MKARTLITIIILFSLASLLIAEDSTMITGKEKRELAITAHYGDDWYVLSLPGMDDVLVVTEKYNSEKWGEVIIDIYYPPNFNFNSKLPAVFVSKGSPEWKSSVALGQLIAASGLIAVVPDYFYPIFSEYISYFIKNARAFSINKKYIAIWGAGHPAAQAFSTVMDKSQKYRKYIKCAVFEAAVLQIYSSDKDNFSNDVPLLFITGSRDFYAIPTHKMFLKVAEEMNIPLEYIVYEEAPHNWVFQNDTEEARDFIQKELDFLKSHLLLK
jgi:hypothetical protein